ncbi:outer membrane protein [Nitratireductor soli]|uniref:outer membrane protein n=1 Tax=Nitratireductor soli TaxID=1670619 RepID=UPI00065DFF03|nr:outer membrane protein [Nitratireductor soli]
MRLLKNAVPVAMAVVLLTAGMVPATAADIIVEVPPAPVTYAPAVISTPIKGWEGGYAGIALGYGFSGKNRSGSEAIQPRGKLGSGFAGWNFQSGGFVYGVEGDVGYNAMKGSKGEVSAKGGFDGSLRARLGYAVTDNLLLYATAGGAAGRLTLTEGGKSDTNTMLGWTAGAGIDAKLTDTMFGRVEYRYTQYGSKTFGSGPVSWGSNKVLVGVGMQF